MPNRQAGHLRGWLLGALALGGLIAAWIVPRLHWGQALEPATFVYPVRGEPPCALVGAAPEQGTSRVLVRTPSNYDAHRAHPLLLVFSPAGFGPGLTERWMGLTHEATARGVIVAYVGARPLSRQLPHELAKLPAQLAADWCLDLARVTLAGHSDGGTLAQVIALLGAQASSVFASAAGLQSQDFAALGCPDRAEVLLMHGQNDDHFPGYGASAAQGWARCLGCKPTPVPDAEGCLAYAGCRGTLRLCLHQGSHLDWPEQARALLIGLSGAPR